MLQARTGRHVRAEERENGAGFDDTQAQDGRRRDTEQGHKVTTSHQEAQGSVGCSARLTSPGVIKDFLYGEQSSFGCLAGLTSPRCH